MPTWKEDVRKYTNWTMAKANLTASLLDGNLFFFDSTGHLSHIRLGQIFLEFYTICAIFTGKELNFGQKIPIFDHFQMS